MRKNFLSLLLVTLFSGISLEVSAAYQIISTNNQQIGSLTKTETIIQDGSSPINQFTLHRLRKNNHPSKGTLLLLPPLGPDYDFYEFDENNDFDKSIAAYFAKKGYDVFGYASRFRNIVAPFCEQNPSTCAEMENWGMQTAVNDISYIRGVIETIHPGELPVIAGHSSGSMYAAATVNAAPEDYRAMLLWEGSIYSARPEVRAINQQWCAIEQAQMSQGIFFDPSSQNFKILGALALNQPNDPSPFPFPPPGTTNEQALTGFLIAPPPSPLTLPVPGYALAAGDLSTLALSFADLERVAKNTLLFVDYAPMALFRDINCSLAGDQTFTDNLQDFDGPVYVIQGGKGFGTTTEEMARLTSSDSVTLNSISAFGHIDHWASPDHAELVDKPVEQWLKHVVFDSDDHHNGHHED